MVKELRKAYERQISESMHYLKMVENAIGEGKSYRVCGATILTNIYGKACELTIDLIKKTKLVNGDTLVEVHVSHKDGKEYDYWERAELLYGSRLDLVYDRVEWVLDTDEYCDLYEKKRQYLIDTWDRDELLIPKNIAIYNVVDATYNFLDKFKGVELKDTEDEDLRKEFNKFFEEHYKEYIEEE